MKANVVAKNLVLIIFNCLDIYPRVYVGEILMMLIRLKRINQ